MVQLHCVFALLDIGMDLSNFAFVLPFMCAVNHSNCSSSSNAMLASPVRVLCPNLDLTYLDVSSIKHCLPAVSLPAVASTLLQHVVLLLVVIRLNSSAKYECILQCCKAAQQQLSSALHMPTWSTPSSQRWLMVDGITMHSQLRVFR